MQSYEARMHDALIKLEGLSLSAARRAADMLVLHFGTLRLAKKYRHLPTRKDKSPGSIGEFALHIQCPWRIETEHAITTGRNDLWVPLMRPEGFSIEKWDYECDGNLLDRRIDDYMMKGDEKVVEEITIHRHGEFSIQFSEGSRLAVFPAGSIGEDWRLFCPESDKPHFVVSGGIIEPNES